MITILTKDEAIAQLKVQGWEVMDCDTEVPFFDVPVPCGTPKALDDIPARAMMVPHDFDSVLGSLFTRVSGDSMEDAGIHDGDIVRVVTGQKICDGDILLVKVDGETTAKAFCIDSDGQPWLLPKNDAYTGFPLTEDQDVRVTGVVKDVLNHVQSVSYRECLGLIEEAKKRRHMPMEFTPQQTSRVIASMASKIEVARHWFGVYRIFADQGAVGDEDFDTFCQMVAGVVPQHEHLPVSSELPRLNIDCFKKPFSEWSVEKAPVKGKRYVCYYTVALQTEKMLNDICKKAMKRRDF